MLYNKNNVRKTNDKKILHKVGKQWKVVSVALLMAIGGGAVATHAANAQSNNGVDNNTAALVNSLETKPAGIAPTSAPASANSSKASSASAKSTASVSYVKVNSASGNDVSDAQNAAVSAAMNHNQAASDSAVINGYVKSLNAKFPTAVKMASTMTSSAQSAENFDKSMASSYSAVANASATKSAVSSLASKAGFLPSDYANYIGMNEQNYANAVKSANDVDNALNIMNSVANTLEGTNWSDAANVASSNAASLYAKSAIYAGTTGKTDMNSAVSSASNAASNNAKALTNATIASTNASLTDRIALSNAVSNAKDVSYVASALSLNPASVNSAVSSYATNFNNAKSSSNNINSSIASYSNDAFSVNKSVVSNASAKSAMSDAVANQYSMVAAASMSVSANSVIASANAHKAIYSAAYSNAVSASNKASNAKNALSAANLAATVAKDATSYLNANMTSAKSASAMSNLANAYHNGGKSAVANLVLGSSSADFASVESNKTAKLLLASMASDEGVNVLALSANASGVKSAVSVASSALKGNFSVSNLNSVKNSMVNAASAATLSAVNSSAAFAKSNNTSLVLANSFASSYASDASDEANSVSEIAVGLTKAGNSFGLNASAYNSAVADEPNANALANAYGMHAANYAPRYVTTKKAVNVYGNNWKKVATVAAGTRLEVTGVKIGQNGALRLNIKGYNGSINSYMSYVKATYLISNANAKNVSVTVNNDQPVYNSVHLTHATKTGKTVKAGTVLPNVTIVSDDGYYGGVTRVETPSGNFLSANTDAVSLTVNNSANNNMPSSNASQPKYSFFD